jgi:periplasmic protein CpxP/Spy
MEGRTHGKRGRLLVVAGIAAGIAAIAVACSHGGMHGRMSPQRMKTVVEWKVNDVLDDIDATDAQRRQVVAAANKVLADFAQLHAKAEASHQAILGELAESRPRAEVIDRVIDERTADFNAFLHRSVDTLLAAHAVLTPDQRRDLVAMAREHMQED